MMIDLENVDAAYRAISRINRRRTSGEIISSLQSKYDLVNIPMMEIGSYRATLIKSAAETSVTNEGCNLNSDEMEFLAYRIPKVGRNSCLSIPDDDPDGLFVIEMITSYFYCDIRRIFIEATYLLGFDENDRMEASNLYRHVTSTIMTCATENQGHA